MNLDNVNKNMEWKDISDEKYRTYMFPNQYVDFFSPSIITVTIDFPQLLNVNYKSGGHKIIDEFGISWYIPAGWVGLKWASFENGVPTYSF